MHYTKYANIQLVFSLFLPLLLECPAQAASAAPVKSGAATNACLEAPSSGAGAPLQVASCNGAQAQQFTFENDGQIHAGPWCVDAWGGLGRDGDPVALWYCHGFSNQRWTRTPAGEIKGLNGKCIDLPAGVPGSKVSLETCRGAATQKWSIGEGVGLNVTEAGAGPGSLPTDACAMKQVRSSPEFGLTVWSPDGNQYIVNKADAEGTPQIYVGRKNGAAPSCITCTDKVNGPKAKKFKMQPHWHPSGRWIVMAVEQETFNKPFFATPEMIEGWLQSGIWVDMYATTPDGSAWFKLQDFGPRNKADGFTGVAFTPDGKKGVWAQIVDGNVFAYTFGKWELIMADFQEVNGAPALTNLRNITPRDTYWIEPGNFSVNGHDLVLTADQGFPDHSRVTGQDQYILNINTGQMTNLTKSPNVWDEHGVFSPDGEKIFYMSSAPYKSDPNAASILGLKTEFMIMDKDGSNQRQITHFNAPGFAESSYIRSTAATGEWSADGKLVSAINLFFPKYRSWEIELAGKCGGTGR